MSVALSVLSLLSVGLLLWGVLNMVRELPELDCQDGPSFQEPVAICDDPICNGGTVETQARSQFAWQSRSHFRAPD
jgi:hypothetical protein